MQSDYCVGVSVWVRDGVGVGCREITESVCVFVGVGERECVLVCVRVCACVCTEQSNTMFILRVNGQRVNIQDCRPTSTSSFSSFSS